MRRSRIWAHVLLSFAPGVPTSEATAQSSRGWYGEAFIGTAWNLPTPIIITRPGEPDVRQRVAYRTHGFKTPLYYSVRAGRGSFTNKGFEGLELELVHHKLHIDHPRPPVEHFEVSHGYNLAYVNLARPSNGFVVRLGAGLVIAHPEGRIAGLRVGGSRRTLLRGGYHIAGGSFQLGVGRRYAFTRSRTTWFAPEAKVTAAWARMPLGDDGASISVPNVAIHLLAGMGAGTGR